MHCRCISRCLLLLSCTHRFCPRLLLPKQTSLAQRVRTSDPLFLDFLHYLLQWDPLVRPSAEEALLHPWLAPELAREQEEEAAEAARSRLHAGSVRSGSASPMARLRTQSTLSEDPRERVRLREEAEGRHHRPRRQRVRRRAARASGEQEAEEDAAAHEDGEVVGSDDEEQDDGDAGDDSDAGSYDSDGDDEVEDHGRGRVRYMRGRVGDDDDEEEEEEEEGGELDAAAVEDEDDYYFRGGPEEAAAEEDEEETEETGDSDANNSAPVRYGLKPAQRTGLHFAAARRRNGAALEGRRGGGVESEEEEEAEEAEER